MAFRKQLSILVIIMGLMFSPFSFLDQTSSNLSLVFQQARGQEDLPTSVRITVCGNGIVETGELCDDGEDNGTYGSSASTRYCNNQCDGWAPYCGDGVYNQEYGEECDDGNNEANDGCSPSCTIEEGGGGGAGGGAGPYPGGTFQRPPTTGVIVRGKAYPGAEVHVLKEGELIGITRANSLANFTFETDDVPSGVTTFGFWAEDSRGVKSISLTITFQVIPDARTTVSGILLPPTINTDKTSVEKGEPIVIRGQTVPESKVYIHISSPAEVIKEVESGGDGNWELTFDTTPLEENNFHTVKAMFQTDSIKSGFSKFVSFYVGEGEPEGVLCPGADLNQDGLVNLMDFSILLFHWGSSNTCADQNQDGLVNLADFSIMMYHWTG